MAANVGRNVKLPEFTLQQLHCRKNRTLGTAGAETGGTGRDIGRAESCRRLRRGWRCKSRRPFTQEPGYARLKDSAGIFTRARQNRLSDNLRLKISTPYQCVQFMLDEFGLPLLEIGRASCRERVCQYV